MRIKLTAITVLLLFIGSIGYAQSNNTYNKQEVLAAVTNLSANNQTWINTNFDRLNNNQVASFMRQSTAVGLQKKYLQPFNSLKAKATEAEIEGFYSNPSESALQALFNKHGVSF